MSLDREQMKGPPDSCKAGASRASSFAEGNVRRMSSFQLRFDAATKQALRVSEVPLAGLRWSVLGLVVLWGLRLAAWHLGSMPRISARITAELSGIADLIVVIATLPLAISGVQGACVTCKCLGSVMTMVTAMMVLDSGAAVGFLVTSDASGRARAFGADSLADRLEAVLGVWECVLLSSVALELSLFVSLWRLYRELRFAAYYPPQNQSLVRGGSPTHVSHLEICCEEGDVHDIQCCHASPNDPWEVPRRGGKHLEAVTLIELQTQDAEEAQHRERDIVFTLEEPRGLRAQAPQEPQLRAPSAPGAPGALPQEIHAV